MVELPLRHPQLFKTIGIKVCGVAPVIFVFQCHLYPADPISPLSH
jgi:hypothetical protein